MEYQDTIQSKNKALLGSLLCHVGVGLALFLSLKATPTLPRGANIVQVSLIQPSAPAAPAPPMPPQVENIEPAEPAATEPPASEPVSQPEPQPQPKTEPKVEPKPVPKPVPKPTAKPKPVEKPVTKPVVKQDVKKVEKVQTKPTTPKKTKADSIRERLQNGPRQKVTGTPQRTSTANTRGTTGSQSTARSSYAGKYAQQAGAQLAAETADYANNVVKPYVDAYWRQPSTSELEYRNVTPVEVSFIVSANGKISGFRITRPSNSRKVNESISAFFNGIDHLPSLASAGVKADQLIIKVYLSLKE